MRTQRSRYAAVMLAGSTLLAGTKTLHAASYTAVYLHPTGMDISVGQGAANGQQVGYTASSNNSDSPHATIWTGTAGSALDINPNGFDSSILSGTNGTQQIGYGFNTLAGNDHALLWAGTSTAIDLNPANITESFAFGISATQQVGNGFGPTTGNNANAFLWTGTAANAVNLHPTSGIYDISTAQGVGGNQQVGYGDLTITPGTFHALLWTGSAASVVDLNPSGYSFSQAFGTSGTHQVGVGNDPSLGTNSHALLWSNVATGVVDLNPAGYDSSTAEAIVGTTEVGWGIQQGHTDTRALLWTGSAGSVVDLQSFLTANYTSSQAFAIAADGTIVGQAVNVTTGVTEAVMWVPVAVPEPGALGFLVAGLMIVGRRRRRIWKRL